VVIATAESHAELLAALEEANAPKAEDVVDFNAFGTWRKGRLVEVTEHELSVSAEGLTVKFPRSAWDELVRRAA
jgi:hypothetical protein